MRVISSAIAFSTFLQLALGKREYDRSVNKRHVKCTDGNPSSKGYKSIADINLDQMEALEALSSTLDVLDYVNNNDVGLNGTAISASSDVTTGYFFMLCPDTFYDASDGPLKVLLDNSVFVCGESWKSENKCTIGGGAVQVAIENSTLSNYDVSTTTFSGIAFTNFSQTSFLVSTSSPSVVHLTDVIWSDFNAPRVVDQVANTESPSVININKAQFFDGTAGDVFLNVGGILNMNKVAVTAISSEVFLYSREGARSSIHESIFSSSSISTVTKTRLRSTQFLDGVTVTDMDYVDHVFLVEDLGSLLDAQEVNIVNIEIDEEEQKVNGGLKGFDARHYAQASITRSAFYNNSGIKSAFLANDFASIVFADSTLGGNIGETTGSSYLVNAIHGGQMFITGLFMENNTGISAPLHARYNATISIDTTCIMSGQSRAIGFVGADSTYTLNRFFVNGESLSSLCGVGESGRLMVESEYKESCLTDIGLCDFECVPGDIEKCGDRPSITMRTKQCPNDPNLVGYTSIADINADQRDIITRSVESSSPEEPVTFFMLCPNTVFDLNKEDEEALEVHVNNSTFVCGESGSVENECKITGGDIQVIIKDSYAPGYNVDYVTITGITFSDFTNASVRVETHHMEAANFMNVEWTEFTAPRVFEKTFNGAKSININVDLASIKDATSTDMFVNDGGHMTLTRLTVANVKANNFFVSHMSALSNLGDSYFTQSTMDAITKNYNASVMNIDDVTVEGMDFLDYGFRVSDVGSELNAANVNIVRNYLEATKSDLHAFVAVNSSIATIRNTTFIENDGLARGYVAANGASVTLSDSAFTDNVGAVSNSRYLFTADQGEIYLNDIFLRNNENFTAVAHAKVNGTVSIDGMCVMSGQSRAVVFIDKESHYTSKNMYVHPSVRSAFCGNNDEGRLTVEKDDPESDCLAPGGSCIMDCVPTDDEQCGVVGSHSDATDNSNLRGGNI